jgi:hypothetical protein
MHPREGGRSAPRCDQPDAWSELDDGFGALRRARQEPCMSRSHSRFSADGKDRAQRRPEPPHDLDLERACPNRGSRAALACGRAARRALNARSQGAGLHQRCRCRFPTLGELLFRPFEVFQWKSGIPVTFRPKAPRGRSHAVSPDVPTGNLGLPHTAKLACVCLGILPTSAVSY